MGVLDNLSPVQRQALLVGAPVVGVFALLSLRGKSEEATPTDEEAAAAAPTTAGFAMPSTDAIGVGQLSEFESLLTTRINDLGVKVEETRLSIPTIPDYPTYAPPPAPPAEDYPAAPAPVAAPGPSRPGECAAFPDELRRRMMPGEYPLGPLPNKAGTGCWYASNYGGVYAYGAPFYGNTFLANQVGPPGALRIVDIRTNPNHPDSYMLINNEGNQYRFPVGT